MKAKWFHHWTDLRKVHLHAKVKFIMEALSTPVSILPKLEVLKLRIDQDGRQYFRQINLFLKLSLINEGMQVKFGAIPVNLIKLTLGFDEPDTDLITNIKRLPKLKILKLSYNGHKVEGHEIDVPLLEELRIAITLRANMLKVDMDELCAPKLNKVIVSQHCTGKLNLSERLARLTTYES